MAPVGPPGAPPTTWAPAPRPPVPPKGRSAGTIVALVLVLFVAVAAAVAFVVTRSGGEDAATGATTTLAPVTTTRPSPTFRLNAGALAAYCANPGQAWPEVPRHVAGQPARTYVHQDDDTFGSGFDGELPPAAASGSTVLSPHTDGRLIDDESVMARTRSVTCVTFAEAVRVGRSCPYVPQNASPYQPATNSYELTSDHWDITVYELHSGGILHKGQIFTPTGHCPAHRYTDIGGDQVAFRMGDPDVLAWLGSHFVDGRPH
ncbi:MAG: hypothetical protein U0P45_13220 [Acidimicrobiales bacterium]